MASCGRETSVEATGGGHRPRWWYSKEFEFERSRSLMPLCCAVGQDMGLCCRSSCGSVLSVKIWVCAVGQDMGLWYRLVGRSRCESVLSVGLSVKLWVCSIGLCYR